MSCARNWNNVPPLGQGVVVTALLLLLLMLRMLMMMRWVMMLMMRDVVAAVTAPWPGLLLPLSLVAVLTGEEGGDTLGPPSRTLACCCCRL